MKTVPLAHFSHLIKVVDASGVSSFEGRELKGRGFGAKVRLAPGEDKQILIRQYSHALFLAHYKIREAEAFIESENSTLILN
ncbi:MAG: hypothetical protein H7249_02550 [Chitinophagaceae bacterium]|nr:hypothetical protein [Oligoflexus sp.]